MSSPHVYVWLAFTQPKHAKVFEHDFKYFELSSSTPVKGEIHSPSSSSTASKQPQSMSVVASSGGSTHSSSCKAKDDNKSEKGEPTNLWPCLSEVLLREIRSPCWSLRDLLESLSSLCTLHWMLKAWGKNVNNHTRITSSRTRKDTCLCPMLRQSSKIYHFICKDFTQRPVVT